MASTNWPVLDGIGLSKKHDVPLVVRQSSSSRLSWMGFRRRRLMLAVFALLVVFLFIKNMPTDVVPVGQRYSPTFGSMAPGHVRAHYPLQENENSEKNETAEQPHGGPIQFPNLAKSLRPHLSWSDNNNVLFAVAELRSASNLVPMACQMAKNDRNKVHVVLLGRRIVGPQEILSVNAISAEDCPVIWHDATPDHSRDSPDAWIDASVRAGFGHCCVALRPQIAFVDNVANKHTVVGALLHEMASSIGIPIMTLPAAAFQNLPWLTVLDHKSLTKMTEVEVDIVIQAYSESAGPLMRLLHSIASANYNGLFYPRLVIELPAQVDPFLSGYLERFQWPPGSSRLDSRVTLRHRLSTEKAKVAEASLRTLESFYPRVSTNSHVLLLSPDAELSPSYLHYLMLTLLEYKYGQSHGNLTNSLFGMSLELPQQKLDGTSPFVQRKYSKKEPFILSQAPNNKAALVMGDKWIELQSFLAHRLYSDPELALKGTLETSITKEYPKWLSEALSLMHAQNYYMLYPSFTAKGDTKLVTIHRELHQSPEEYAQKDAVDKRPRPLDAKHIVDNDVLTGNIDLPSGNEHIVSTGAPLPLQKLLLPRGKALSRSLPKLGDVPLIAYSGRTTDWSKSRVASVKFAQDFSSRQGGCASSASRNKAKEGSVEHLFCGT